MASPPQLQVSDFEEYFEQVHGHPPFGWQKDLIARVGEGAGWPALIDLPTGAGKTSTIDIALFNLALDAGEAPSDRTAPRRIVTVVDRRIVVDQATEHARKIAEALESAPSASAAVRVWASLGALHDGPANLHYAALRGGIVRDERWARSPDAAAVLSSTVDQIGSRLLFRGYGISWRTAPIQAGLLGNDTLLLLDEVHLSQPFAQTLARLTEMMASSRRPLQVVELSATPDKKLAPDQQKFPTEPLRSDNVEPVLRRRIVAMKPCDIEAVAVPANRAKADAKLAGVAAGHAMRLADLERTSLIGVVLNRVDTARLTYRALRNKGYDVTLLTGRMRPLDRDDVVATNIGFWTDRDRRDTTKVVVATQCIEAGADFDFDAIVTESAAIDSLRQRFGRVDRRGTVHHTGEPVRSVILNRGDGAVFEDPVYGPALGNTWTWLCELPLVDFGISQLPEPPQDCYTLKPDAPILTPVHLEFLSQTSLRPARDLDIEPWLHGSVSTSPSVSVIWRDDLNDLVGASGYFDTEDSPARQAVQAEAAARLAFSPPISTESIELPLHISRQWLDPTSRPRTGIDSLADVDAQLFDGAAGPVDSEAVGSVVTYQAGASNDDDRVGFRAPRDLSPGDTIVVPSTFGGLDPDHRGWDPGYVGPVTDLCRRATQLSRGRDLVRLGPWLASVEGSHDLNPSGQSAEQDTDANGAESESIRTVLYKGLRNLSSTEPIAAGTDLAARVGTLEADETLEVDRTVLRELGLDGDEKSWRVLVTVERGDGPNEQLTPGQYQPLRYVAMSRPLYTPDGADRSSDVDVDDAETDAPSFTGVGEGVLLADHLAGVGRLARQFGANLGLPGTLVEDMGLAADLHDVGKADRRFQRWLAPGADYDPETVLAKSRQSSRHRALVWRARAEAGYPKGARHEVLSVAMAAEEVQIRASDPDMALHLMAAHHGHCRPFPPAYHEPVSFLVRFALDDVVFEASLTDAATLVEFGSELADRFHRLNTAFGPHQLAFYEAIIRLADQRRSELETKGTPL